MELELILTYGLIVGFIVAMLTIAFFVVTIKLRGRKVVLSDASKNEFIRTPELLYGGGYKNRSLKTGQFCGSSEAENGKTEKSAGPQKT